MNKIVLFSNIKGGVGKTTLCAHFAEYLAEHEYPVATVDADLQASLSRHRERDVKEDPNRPLPWEVIKLNTFDGKKVKAVIEKLKQINGIIVVDCPGNLNDNNLSILFEAADFIIVPMAYDVDTIDATNIFVDVVKKRSQAKLLFLPNRINVSCTNTWRSRNHSRPSSKKSRRKSNTLSSWQTKRKNRATHSCLRKQEKVSPRWWLR